MPRLEVVASRLEQSRDLVVVRELLGSALSGRERHAEAALQRDVLSRRLLTARIRCATAL